MSFSLGESCTQTFIDILLSSEPHKLHTVIKVIVLLTQGGDLYSCLGPVLPSACLAGSDSKHKDKSSSPLTSADICRLKEIRGKKSNSEEKTQFIV